MKAKRSFTVKTSAKQTKFSKKDLIKIQERFEKNSEWVLVNSNGENMDSSQRSTSEQQNIQIRKNNYVNNPIDEEENESRDS